MRTGPPEGSAMLPRRRSTIAGGRPRVVAACASANARPTTRVLGGACSPRTLEPRRSPADARMHPRAGFIRRLRRVSSSSPPPSGLRVGCPLPAPCRNKAPSARRCHPPESRSTLVVSHHLGGFLQPYGAGIVAARCRSWGSSRFATGPTGSALPKEAFQPASAFPAKRSPLEDAPCPQCLLPHHESPEGSRVHGRRGLQPGLLSPSTVSGDRRRSPSMGFCSRSDHRIPLAADGGPRSSSQPKLPILERFTSKNGTEVPSPR